MLKKTFLHLSIYLILLFLLEITSILLAMYNSYSRYGHFDLEYSLTPIINDESLMNVGYCSCDDTNSFSFREPDGIQYKKSPVVIFGCSYAYGQYLKGNQTFSNKLSRLTGRPVYNRALPAKGLANMYYQATSDKFYQMVPPSDFVFYVMISDHFRRVLVRSFDYLGTIKNSQCNYKYDKKHDRLVMTNNFLSYRILENSYFYKIMNSFYVSKFIKNPRNAQYLTDLALVYFIKTRESLEKHWNKKFKFIVVLYEGILYEDILIEKLRNNNFIVLNLRFLGKKHILDSTDYRLPDGHPNEAAWDLAVPLIVNELRKQGVNI